jgi:murein DD-endopeptidase MepM/ murein hydrolase activator NlpD
MTSHVMAQHQGDLSREELLARIDLSQRLLDETRDREAESLTALRILNQQIDLRQALLQRLTEEVYQQAAAVEKAELLGCEMEEDIAQIRRNYLLAAQATYHQLGTDNFWLAVLSAGGLSDAFYRMQYFRRFVSYRDEQMDLLEATRKELAEQRQRLAEALAESQARLDLRSDQLTALERDRARQRVLYQALKQQAQRFREQLVEERLRLQRLIQESEQLYAHSVQPVAEGYGLTFPQQKGRLTWPVPPTQSVVIARFGQTEDPYGNLVANDGIYLRTPEGQQVSAVYAGRVTAVTEIPMNGGALVIVEHGKYRSVYANLEKAFVQKDQLIAAGQTLGLVRTDRRTGETVLHFLIYTLPNRFVNPEQWLR